MKFLHSKREPKPLGARAFASLLFGVMLGMPLGMHVLARFVA